MFACAKQNDLVQFVHLVARYGHDVAQGRDAQGHTLAHWAAQQADGAFLVYLHEIGVAVDAPSHDGTAALHPIHWACAAGNLSALKTLVRHLNVDINTCDAKKQRSPLLIAAQHGKPMAALFCVRHGANVHLVDADGDTAVHWAAYQGATDILAVLHYLDVNSDARDSTKMLSGEFPIDKNVTIQVEVTYNGISQDEIKRRLPKSIVVKDKLSNGIPEENKTALETAEAQFAHNQEIVIRQFGLENCQDTIVGDSMLRGVSGGEAKRVKTGEMEFGTNYVKLMDEIITGLDSAATYDIIKTQRSIAKKLHKTPKSVVAEALLALGPRSPSEIFGPKRINLFGQVFPLLGLIAPCLRSLTSHVIVAEIVSSF
ncbi:hypothetical protein PsorP6_003105 [Peronosclerospora sorghi]|uniref:Uncharacterized protein n=1 Tax=Peronosclerospora sorghi TaxID=230839 RepID=A0ACC0VMM8_9STRA|nr:hypothetical protein PsorP6_003105 [Peronosclerospora sorghi]